MAFKSSAMDNATLDQFYANVSSKEPSVRLACFPTLETYLSAASNSVECEDSTGFLNGLLKWIEGSNFRVRLLSNCHRISNGLISI